MEKLQIDLNRLGEWEVENEMVINAAKSKAVCFTRARVTEPLNYSLRDIVIPQASSCKYLGIILLSNISKGIKGKVFLVLNQLSTRP
jgi:hypothetical protein